MMRRICSTVILHNIVSACWDGNLRRLTRGTVSDWSRGTPGCVDERSWQHLPEDRIISSLVAAGIVQHLQTA